MPGKWDSGWQLYCLFLSGGCGFWLCLLYELCGLFRRTATKRVVVFLWDIVFCLLAAVSLFLFALPMTGGILRWFILCGVALGFGVCRLTFGRLLRRLARAVSFALKRLEASLHRAKKRLRQWGKAVVSPRIKKPKKSKKN